MTIVLVDCDRYYGKRYSTVDVALNTSFILMLLDLLPRVKLVSPSGNEAAVDELSEFLSLAILELCEAI